MKIDLSPSEICALYGIFSNLDFFEFSFPFIDQVFYFKDKFHTLKSEFSNDVNSEFSNDDMKIDFSPSEICSLYCIFSTLYFDDFPFLFKVQVFYFKNKFLL